MGITCNRKRKLIEMRLSDFPIKLTGLLLVCIPIIFEVAFTSVLLYYLHKAEYSALQEANSRYLASQAQELSSLSYEAASEIALFLMTKGTSHKEAYERASTRELQQLSKLKSVMATLHTDQRTSGNFQNLTASFYRFNRLSELLLADNTQHGIGSAEAGAQLKLVLAEMLSNTRAFMAGISAQSPEYTDEALHQRQMLLYAIGLGMILHVAVMIGVGVIFGQEISGRVAVLINNTKRLKDGQSLGEIMSGNDEIAFLDREFHNMARSLQAATQHRRETVNMISHDLRTPITTLALFIERLRFRADRDMPPDPTLGQQLISLTATTQFLLRLINDFLDMEKIESGELHLDIKPLLLRPALEEAISAVRPMAEEKEVTIDLDTHTPTEIAADELRFKQIAINLLANAVNHSPKHGKVYVKSHCRQDKQRVAISDSGSGIPKDLADRIFEPFFQVTAGTTTPGSGLGLAICHRLCMLQNATIGVESQEGQGSTFWVDFEKSPKKP